MSPLHHRPQLSSLMMWKEWYRPLLTLRSVWTPLEEQKQVGFISPGCNTKRVWNLKHASSCFGSTSQETFRFAANSPRSRSVGHKNPHACFENPSLFTSLNDPISQSFKPTTESEPTRRKNGSGHLFLLLVKPPKRKAVPNLGWGWLQSDKIRPV